MLPFALFASWRCTVVQNVFFKIRGRRGGEEAKRRRRRRSRAIAARWNTTTKKCFAYVSANHPDRIPVLSSRTHAAET